MSQIDPAHAVSLTPLLITSQLSNELGAKTTIVLSRYNGPEYPGLLVRLSADNSARTLGVTYREAEMLHEMLSEALNKVRS
jgi:hypothetical protein